MILFMGFENQYENSFRDRNICGMRKCMSDHNSIKLFFAEASGRSQKGTIGVSFVHGEDHVKAVVTLTWRGVPVSSSRRCELKFISVCQRWLWKFLIFCASSRIM